MEPPEGKKFYGSVTVSERGQIVIPAEARKDFSIKPGDKLLVLGDLTQGLAVVTISGIQKLMSNSKYFLQTMGAAVDEEDQEERKQ